MNREVEFYRLIEKQEGVNLAVLESGKMAVAAAVYVNRVCGLAESYGIEGFPKIRINKTASEITIAEARNALFMLENYLNELYARNIFELNPEESSTYLMLDEDWRSKATSYVAHIREVVAKAETTDELRESILKQLNELQSEIDRERTRLDAAVNMLLTITDAIGKGAKNLEPAAVLTKKMVDAFSGLWRKSQESTTPKLPPPDKLGLPDLSDEEQDVDSKLR